MTDKEMCKYFGHLENHQYKHYNRALGVQVQSKEHFKKLLEQGGYVPLEKGNQMAEACQKGRIKPYDGISPKLGKFLGEVKMMADKDGNIEVTDKFVEGLKEHGLDLKHSQWA